MQKKRKSVLYALSLKHLKRDLKKFNTFDLEETNWVICTFSTFCDPLKVVIIFCTYNILHLSPLQNVIFIHRCNLLCLQHIDICMYYFQKHALLNILSSLMMTIARVSLRIILVVLKKITVIEFEDFSFFEMINILICICRHNCGPEKKRETKT